MSIKSSASNFFFPIIDTWPEYFENPHEGLGTTYERFLLHEFFERLNRQYRIERLIEVPSFGMTGISGINSLWWAQQHKQVTLVDDHPERLIQVKKVWASLGQKAHFVLTDRYEQLPFSDQSFDLSWNFASLWFVQNLESFLMELSRLTRQVIFICVPNRLGLGYQLRKHWPGARLPDLKFENIRASKISSILQQSGWQLREKGYFDIPPWPDFPLKKEALFRKLKLAFLLRLFNRGKRHSGQPQRMSIVDYFSGERPDMPEEVFKFKFLERAPFPVKQLWAHHQYLIFDRQ